MMLYTSPDLTHRMDYFKAKFPSLKSTTAFYCQDANRDEQGRLKVGLYDTEHNIIVLYDHPALDPKMPNILAHEVAHALNWINGRGRGHDKMWVNYCNLIYQVTGVLPTHIRECQDESMDAAMFIPPDLVLKAYHTKIDSINVTCPEIKETDDDTLIYIKRHKSRIRYWMLNFSNYLIERAVNHDASKLQEPELSMWREMDKEPRHPYSDDPNSPYQQKLKKYFPVFEEHWKNNRHHIEYYKYNPNDFGIDLIDLVELICDQLLGYKYEIGYSRAMEECRRLGKKYGIDEETGEVKGPLTPEIISLMENTIRNYFCSFAGQHPEFNLKDLPQTGNAINIFI